MPLLMALPAFPPTKPLSARKPPRRARAFFARFMDALVESRLQHVQREIARHAHLWLIKPNIDEMPFGGR